MEAIPPSSRPPSHLEKGVGDTLPTHPRVTSGRDTLRSNVSPQQPSENRSPANLPRACESMLKTTTETGDIGMFSIKPSRVPQSLSTPRRQAAKFNTETGQQKPRQDFQPYGVPIVDDRRRLPSYTRDAASEVISLYETASQKSASRVFDEPDYRSYSMTQTSYSSYTLSNHRSYASLRSQVDGNNQVQRPRSPFAYPTRLKRPGFRPSSPALTDGGIVDYSRRAEIERIPQGTGHSTSSPSSLYAQRRRPHQSLRPEANRSTPSLLSQSSPPRRSSSPLVSQSNGNNDWSRRAGPGSVNTSPARSTFSLASTVNLYTTAQAPSTTTTPGKIPPPSPLYYDYTEDFEVEVYTEPVALDPPPLFRIDKTIPEDRPMSSERLPAEVQSSQESTNNVLQAFTSENTISRKSSEGVLKRRPTSSEVTTQMLTIQSSPAETDTAATAPHVDSIEDHRSVILSGLGYGAQQLRSHVDEAFRLFPESTIEITDPNKVEHNAAIETPKDHASDESPRDDTEAQSTRTSYSMISNIPSFPPPPKEPRIQQLDSKADIELDKTSDSLMRVRGPQEPLQRSVPPKPTEGKVYQERVINRPFKIDPDIKSRVRVGSGTFGPIKVGLIDPTARVINSEARNGPKSMHEAPQELRRTPMTSPTISDDLILRKTVPEDTCTPPMSLFNRHKAGEGQALPRIQPLERSQYYSGGRRLELSSIPDHKLTEVPNFSHQFPKKEMARSESPMIAPKPISPARQLKLKNSVPQLMKALPPLPPEPSSRPVSPTDQPIPKGKELPYRFSPLQQSFNSIRNPVEHEIPKKSSPSTVKIEEKVESVVSKPIPVYDISGEKSTESESSEALLPLPRLKLKLKNSNSRPMSPPDSRPWNLAENYPWSTQDANVRLPPIVQNLQPQLSKPPKFKLKVTRASSSSQGTVRVNRDSAESRPLTGLHLRNPKDLFSPTTGIDNIFRQVSRHLHSRKTSTASNCAQHESSVTPIPTSDPTASCDTEIMESKARQPPSTSTNPPNASEARSVFSDDSSHVQGSHSLRLRGRLSNLRARIAAPYSMRTGTQSDDDITWRDRNGPEPPTPSATRSIPNLQGNRASADNPGPMRRMVERAHRQKLKAKVQGWFKGAKSAIVARVRSRSTTGGGLDTDVVRG